MPLQAGYDSLDAIPVELRQHYVEVGGKWHLDCPVLSERLKAVNAEAKQHRERADAAEAKLAESAAIADQLTKERRAMADVLLAQALAKGRATAEGIELLSVKLADRVSIEMVEGKRVVKVNGAADLDGLVAEARSKWPAVFSGSGMSGSGAPYLGGPATTGRHTLTRSEFDRLSPSKRAAVAQTTRITD